MHKKSGTITQKLNSLLDMKTCASPLSIESFHQVSLKSSHKLLRNSAETILGCSDRRTMQKQYLNISRG